MIDDGFLQLENIILFAHSHLIHHAFSGNTFTRSQGNNHLLNLIAQTLLEKETLDLKDLDLIIAQAKPDLLAKILKQKGTISETAKGKNEELP